MEEPGHDGGDALTQSAEGPPCKLCLTRNPAAAQTHSLTSCRLLEAAKTFFSVAQILNEKDFTASYCVQWSEEESPCRLLEAAKALFSAAQTLDEMSFTSFYIVSSHVDLDCDPSEDLHVTKVEPEPDEPADLCETEEDWPAAQYVFGQTCLSLC